MRGTSPPTSGVFPPASVIVYHRNQDSDGLTVNETLTQQGLASLIDTTPDYWRDNQFGMALTGDATMKRVSASVLGSVSPASDFQLRATVLAVQTETVDEWLDDMSVLLASSPANPRPAHDAFWQRFWGRSYIDVDANATGPLTQMYAVTRYTQAIQSRNTIWPSLL